MSGDLYSGDRSVVTNIDTNYYYYSLFQGPDGELAKVHISKKKKHKQRRNK